MWLHSLVKAFSWICQDLRLKTLGQTFATSREAASCEVTSSCLLSPGALTLFCSRRPLPTWRRPRFLRTRKGALAGAVFLPGDGPSTVNERRTRAKRRWVACSALRRRGASLTECGWVPPTRSSSCRHAGSELGGANRSCHGGCGLVRWDGTKLSSIAAPSPFEVKPVSLLLVARHLQGPHPTRAAKFKASSVPRSSQTQSVRVGRVMRNVPRFLLRAGSRMKN